MTADPFAASRERWAKFIDAEMAKGFRSIVAGIVAIRLAVTFGIRTFPAWQGTKKPRYEGWQEKATASPAGIAYWIRRFELPDFIAPTGRATGLWILDIDGPRGRARIAELEAKYGPLPKTWTVVSGRVDGGEHLWFKPTPDGPDLKSLGKAFIDGKRDCIDQKGRGGYVVIPGSLHASGRRYQWAEGCAPDECELASLPDAWLEILDWADEIGEAKSLPIRNPSAPRGSLVTRTYDPKSLVIGDGEGQGGFDRPIYANAMHYFRHAGTEASEEKIIATLWRLIESAHKGPGRCVERYRPGNGDLERAVRRAREYVKQKGIISSE